MIISESFYSHFLKKLLFFLINLSFFLKELHEWFDHFYA